MVAPRLSPVAQNTGSASAQLDPEECFKRKNMDIEEYNEKTRLNLISDIGKAHHGRAYSV